MVEVWYRYEDVQYAPPPDEWGDRHGTGRLAVELRTYEVVKHTPKGVWIDYAFGRRFVLREANKRFACPTKGEAAASFKARKLRQAKIYEARASRARRALSLVETYGFA